MRRAVSRDVLSSLFLLTTLFGAFASVAGAASMSAGPGYRFEKGGWVYVHLEGTPEQIGFQHGALLSAEVADMVRVIKLESAHSTQRDWAFYREAARKMLWPHIDVEYQQELTGIAKGVQSKGVKLDVWDIVALNGGIEMPQYYVPWLNKREKAVNAPHILPEGRCSAFIATGSYTKGGKIVIAHNNWSSYAEGARWTVIFDIIPAKGHHMLMDGEPGVITSQDDFGVNDAGLLITETTITQFEGFDPDGKPEFVRSRKAMQYASSNFARDPKLMKEEASDFDSKNLAASENARHVTWDKKMAGAKGRIDIEMAEQFLADQDDSFTSKTGADERTLCGHVDTVKAGIPEWDWGPYYPGGAVTGKVADSDLAGKMSLVAHAGHPCGDDFHAASFLAAHANYAYLKPILKDMPSGPWTGFSVGEK